MEQKWQLNGTICEAIMRTCVVLQASKNSLGHVILLDGVVVFVKKDAMKVVLPLSCCLAV